MLFEVRRRDVPVDRGDDAALRKRRGWLVLPEPVVRSMALIGLVESVVERGDEQEEVRQACRDLVKEDRLA